MRTLVLGLAAAGLLASCAPMEETSPPGAVADESLKQCGADRFQSYVGRNRTELPPKPATATWRVVCNTCAMTMDFNPERMNVTYVEATGVIDRVTCG